MTKERVAAALSCCMTPPQQQTAEMETASPPHHMTLIDAYLEDSKVHGMLQQSLNNILALLGLS